MRRIATLIQVVVLAGAVLALVVWLRPGPIPPAHAATVTVAVGDIWYCDQAHANGVVCETTVQAGDTVVWDFSPAQFLTHTVTECGASCDNPVPKDQALWNSGSVPGGSTTTFQYTFSQPGTYLYYCQQHPANQRGRIIVQAAATPTPTAPGQAGDVNKDGVVNAIDAALVLQYDAGLLPSINANADVNRDGRRDSVDAALVLQFTAGLIDHLPV